MNASKCTWKISTKTIQHAQTSPTWTLRSLSICILLWFVALFFRVYRSAGWQCLADELDNFCDPRWINQPNREDLDLAPWKGGTSAALAQQTTCWRMDGSTFPHMEKQRSCWWKSRSGFRPIGVEMEKLCAANLTGVFFFFWIANEWWRLQ